MMKKLLLYITLLYGISLHGQVTITLKDKNTPSGTQLACQSIILDTGFVFQSAANKSLTLIVNPSTCDPYAGKQASLSENQNYIRTRTYTDQAGKGYLDQIQYFDGLGRPTQTVQRGITPLAADLVVYQEYDGFGRDDKSWLPAVASGNNGAYMPLATYRTKAMTTYNSDSAYSRPVYEASPLNRVLQQYGPGKEWYKVKAAVKTEYLTNSGTTGQLSCALFTVDGSGMAAKVKKTSFYSNNELYVTKMTDEDTNISYEFKDKLGQVVLTRQIFNGTNLDTYYVYDDFGNLCFVLPPLASDVHITNNGTAYNETNSTPIKQYAYLYKYDSRNRCIWKKLPGCDPIFYVYDKADRLIFTQDGEQQNKKPTAEWTFTIPDAFGRVVLTGTCTTVNSATIVSGRFDDYIIKAEFSTAGTHQGYNVKVGKTTFNDLTIQSAQIHTAYYYDNYDFRGMKNIPASATEYIAKAGYGIWYGTDYSPANKYKNKGMLTGSLTAQMKPDGAIESTYLYAVMYYDNKGQLVQAKSNNHLKGVEEQYIAYNFTGQPTQKLHVHTQTGTTTGKQEELYAYSYDHAGRLLKTTHKLNTNPAVVLAENTYDKLGRLETNKKNNQASLKTTYAYNIRSWTTSMKSPLYQHTLYYNNSYKEKAVSYSGNISAMNWNNWDQTKNVWEKDRAYAFTYDALSRMTSADYMESGIASNNYKIEKINYDKHGNIRSLKRYGKKGATSYGMVDQLAMTYIGNQLINVKDSAVNVLINESADFKDHANNKGIYAYNKNGAMQKDTHKGISEIAYNSLNLPRAIEIANPQTQGRIKYTYSAAGQKLQTIHETDQNLYMAPMAGVSAFSSATSTKQTTDYVGNKIYKNNTLDKILVDGGYYDMAKKMYIFYLTDHLGNNRVVADQNGKVLQKTHYYPFGMAFAESTGQDVQPFKYNGKELDTEHGLNMYDYSARFYEPSTGRFSTIDPLAEKYYSWSPYAYCYNNPLKYIDKDGRNPIAFGFTLYEIGVAAGIFGGAAVATAASTPTSKGLPASPTRDIEQKAMVHIIVAAVDIASSLGLLTSEAANPGKIWQDKQDRKAKDALDAAQAAVAEAIKETMPDGSGNPKGGEPKGGITGKILGGTAIVAGIVQEITNPNPSKDAHDAHKERVQEKKQNSEATDRSWVDKLKDWFTN